MSAARVETHAEVRPAQDTPVELPALARWEHRSSQWRQPPQPIGVLPPGKVYPAVKATGDFLAALTLLVVAAPVLLVVLALVKLSSQGPALYSQVRLGKGGRPFRIWKVRTMYHECEAHSGACWSRRGDPRITPLGRVLRATHLDELPQLWNILWGEMSLIGPRPERPEFAVKLEKVIPYYRDRLLVRPGVTGLAQVQLPPDTDVESVRRKVACDLTYIGHLSLGLDLRILALTVLHVFGLPCHGLCRLLLPRLGKPAPSLVG